MRTAIYIDAGRTQVVLTPECELEKNALKELSDHKAWIQVVRGRFYPCVGGYTRHTDTASSEDSVFLVVYQPNISLRRICQDD